MEKLMRALSPNDGSADAVREAADAALNHGDNRPALERELDRLNTAIQGSAAALGQHLSWTIVAQSFLLTAWVVVLVGSWILPIPGKRWLLTGIAVFALLAVVLTYLGLRAARDRVGPLKRQRQRVEEALERVAARPPAFARQGAITALLAQASTRGLPLLIIGGWVALTLYTLALPLPTDSKTTSVSVEPRTNGTNGVAAPALKTARPARPPRPQRRGHVRRSNGRGAAGFQCRRQRRITAAQFLPPRGQYAAGSGAADRGDQTLGSRAVSRRPGRLALVDEGLHAFQRRRRPSCCRPSSGRRSVGGLDAVLDLPVEQLLAQCDRRRGLGDDGCGQAIDFGIELSAGNDAVDQPRACAVGAR